MDAQPADRRGSASPLLCAVPLAGPFLRLAGLTFLPPSRGHRMPPLNSAASGSGGKLRVLVAETYPGEVFDALNAMPLIDMPSLEITSVSTASTLLPTIQLVNPEVVFVDLALHPSAPLDLVRGVHRTLPNIPLIILAGSADKENAHHCLQEGATDYLLKGQADRCAVERVLRGALERNTVNGLTDLLRDPLTRLYNLDGFSALASRALQSAEKSVGRMILLTAEIENLDDLAREFGPSIAEQAVRDIAALLSKSFRRTDVVARLAEGRFAVLALDALEPTGAIMRQRVERHLLALNRSRAPWGDIALKLATVFWSAGTGRPFHSLLQMLPMCSSSSAPDAAVSPRPTRLHL